MENEDAPLPPEESDLAARTKIFHVSCKHIDPSLDGDSSDYDALAICLTQGEAETHAAGLQKADPDQWNSCNVNPMLLKDCEHRIIREALRRMKAGAPGPIQL